MGELKNRRIETAHLTCSHVNALEKLDAEKRIEWAFDHIDGNYVLSSSFGIQSAVMLHMVTQISPNMPIVLTDTEYLFPETYQFIEQLTERLKLNLHVYKATKSASSQLNEYGKLWQQGKEGLHKYHLLNKVEPFERAMKTLKANCWFSGVRRQQSTFREHLPVITELRGHTKVHPIVDWTNRDIHQYLLKHKLPYHPLFEKGYTTIGDVHSSRPQDENERESDTRFNGLQRECGLHSVNNISN